MNRNVFLVAVILTTMSALTMPCSAQKMDNIQQVSVYAEGAVAIDGNDEEWKSTYQAFNKATGVFYTLLNDMDNLYLVVHSNNKISTNKIMRGGISFQINTSGRKKDAGSVITFPVIRHSDLRKMNQEIRGTGGSSNEKLSLQEVTKRADSVMKLTNKRQIALFQEINVSGVPDIKDSIISTYNEYGIRVGMSIKNENELHYELSVPIKLLKLNSGKFAYSIKLNGLAIRLRTIPGEFPDAGGWTITVFKNSGQVGAGNMTNKMAEMRDMTVPTYFWAKYNLAKPKEIEK